MDKSKLQDWIEENMFRSDGALNAKMCKKEWFENYNKEDIYECIIEETSFLDQYDDVIFSERLWYIVNNIETPVLCGYENCFEKPKFFSMNEGYRYDFCSNSCAQNSEKVREKIKKTSNERYGSDYYLSSEKGIQEIKDVLKEKYGVENPSQLKEVREKRRETWKEKYGESHPLKAEKSKKRLKETNLEKYGYDNPMKSKEIKEKSRRTRLNDVFDRFIKESKKLGDEVELLFDKENFKGVYRDHHFFCNRCNSEFKGTLADPRCYNCYPSQNTSKGEKEIYYFIDDVLDCEVKNNVWGVLGNKELDIYIPDKKIAVEYNGLYYHSENYGGKDKFYHLNKTRSCEDKDIQLIQVFEDEWVSQKERTKNKILYILDEIDYPPCFPEVVVGINKIIGYVDRRWNIFQEFFESFGFEFEKETEPVSWGVDDFKRTVNVDDSRIDDKIWDCGYLMYIYE